MQMVQDVNAHCTFCLCSVTFQKPFMVLLFLEATANVKFTSASL